MPLDQLFFLHERLRDRERRAFARSVTSGQLGMLGFAKDIKTIAREIIEQGEKQAVPFPFQRGETSVTSSMPTPITPYPIHPAVARGLALAMNASLLNGDFMASLPATEDGLPLSRAFERIQLAGKGG
ncbi:hypothetical protein [Deinococcus peraridilitoris]|uniref:Uncharacterized protein n=1 Tax=Deinococcus peraridilitoris (strain DSM 19664 / LMG 22246 / CIP 109416 / KR-200) TaxID=937777 RepID=L0A1L8_DEIPD|nr:hypothetical protein [Deinococcus peraridilitoris]AFZ67067.1 hypothetical protein Deipe_1526 [Deinococcus peraridilitoris DSM 19664]